ncbi:Metastasis-associated protein MTA2, partial [Ophiophagus hannah]
MKILDGSSGWILLRSPNLEIVFNADYVYFENSSSNPYLVRRIEELNKMESPEALLFSFSLPLPICGLICLIKKNEFQENLKKSRSSQQQRHQLKHRELFLSRQFESLPATHIRKEREERKEGGREEKREGGKEGRKEKREGGRREGGRQERRREGGVTRNGGRREGGKKREGGKEGGREEKGRNGGREERRREGGETRKRGREERKREGGKRKEGMEGGSRGREEKREGGKEKGGRRNKKKREGGKEKGGRKGEGKEWRKERKEGRDGRERKIGSEGRKKRRREGGEERKEGKERNRGKREGGKEGRKEKREAGRWILRKRPETLLSSFSQDCFFYSLVFDPVQKTLLADQGEIRVGCKYQAEIPERLAEGESDNRNQQKMEMKVWDPDNPLTDRQIDQFLVVARAVGTFARALDCSSSIRQPSLHMSAAAASRDITLFHAMDTLQRNGYDLAKAMSTLVPQGGPVLCRDEMEEWSASEAMLFEEALEKYGKDFNDIRQDFLPWKSLASIVQFYYMWKTTDRYIQQKRLKAAEADSKLKQVYIPT